MFYKNIVIKRSDGILQEIITLEQFKEAKTNMHGLIAITDINLSKNYIHHPKCSYVHERYFIQKITNNGGKNGKYYYVVDQQQGLSISRKMKLCDFCFSNGS
jgi:hypothetical protein